ncbi:hypothetical protein EJ070_31700 [Mesorhizobium sp. M1E.F.Ca.ET.045.02.1.1]|uniref:hypothetical protein n=1 Tax=Mesorhizobium sp. M1E.F.Ca.ET.045.02.1.1 TaxID=2493672 RepID=UPI000F751C32|nr:hypothetical protein [Mesorhizobium sp. M1E.F.Ca.ET.045.02.1.1]AZO24783.1 hypothetical protein EJ070_31700 [Mesorhizobium sp. M1E.F.Ca.ET.045.02.1.1]
MTDDLTDTFGLFYVAPLKLQFDVVNGRVLTIERRPKPSPQATRVHRLDVTDERTHWNRNRDRLYLDALGLLQVKAFIRDQYPRSSPKTRELKLLRMISGSMMFDEIHKGALTAIGLRRHEPDEIGMFANRARDAHPLEFRMLRQIIERWRA